MIVYKVVDTLDESHLYSCIITTPEWMCEYRINTPTLPIKGTYLMAFRTLKQAECFMGNHDHQAIYRAEAKVAPIGRKLILFWPLISSEHLNQFWDGKIKRNTKTPAPDGTVFCYEITLLEKVE